MTKDKAALDGICENFIKNTMDFYDIPGIALGVSVGGYTFTSAGGYRDYETKEPMQEDTVFHCTSVSKLFTAVGIMKLVEKGKLSLTERLCDIVPWMSIADKRWEDITIESMLTHTSGLTDVNYYRWHEHRDDENALKDYAMSDEVMGRKLLWDPSENKFRYSSMAYDLLGLVIAEVSGMTFEEFMDQEIFKPLDMKDSTFMLPDEGSLAVPHSKGRDRTIKQEEVYPYTRQHAPSSTLKSTTADLLKWASVLMNYALLHDARDIWQVKVTVPDTGEQMGLGWFIRQQKVQADDGEHTYTLVGHEGSDDGFRTSFWMCPEEEIAVVLLCNLTDAPLKKLSKKLFDFIVLKG